ncbi:MAG TPA: hypothetical protein VHP33_34730 [Polyangiaceae bacterium]|nr:hypothetical protein [Polyangiaceae bacterium]
MRISQRYRIALGFGVALSVWGVSLAAHAQTKIACIGEATTHSAHRIHDPEYPEFMGRFLDVDFKVDPTPQNPLDGGMLFGGGTNYRVGNFGLPTGTAIETNSADVETAITSPRLTDAEKFGPDVVILGPYGPHEPYAEVSVDNFLPDLRKLAARVVAFPNKPTVFLALPIARYGEDNDTIRRSIHDWTVQVATEMKLPSIDLWTEFMGKRSEFYDQNHLAEAGRQRMGNFIGAAVKSWKQAGTGGSGAGGMNGSSGASGASAAGSGGAGAGAGGAGVTGSAGLETGGGPSRGTTEPSGGAEAGSTAGPAVGGSASTGLPAAAGSGQASSTASASSSQDASGCAMRPSNEIHGGWFAALAALALRAAGTRRRRCPASPATSSSADP